MGNSSGHLSISRYVCRNNQEYSCAILKFKNAINACVFIGRKQEIIFSRHKIYIEKEIKE